MKNLKKLGKNLLLPAAGVVFLFLGAGSAVTIATTSTRTSTSTATAAADDADVAPSAALAQFCRAYWGTLIEHGRLCRFEQWYHLNLKHAGRAPLTTGFELLPGDTLRVESTRFPEALVGDGVYDTSEEKFVVRDAGYLAFRPVAGQVLFSVERLGVERCFIDRAGAIDSVACPE